MDALDGEPGGGETVTSMPMVGGWHLPDDHEHSIWWGGVRLWCCQRPAPVVGGWVVGLTGLEGWDEPATDESSTSDHPSGDGLVAGLPRLGARRISLSCTLYASSIHGLGSLADAMDAMSVQRRTVFRVAEGLRGVSREVDVRLVQAQMTRRSPTVGVLTLSLAADDPVRWSSEVLPLTNGTLRLRNRGSVTAWPLIDLVGPHSALTITHPGGTFTLPAISSGQSRLVDCRSGAVYAGGVRVSGGSGSWPRVPAGSGSWTIDDLKSESALLRRGEAWS